MALTPSQLFVFHDCLKRLHQELRPLVSPDMPSDQDFLQSLDRALQPAVIEVNWEKRMRGKKELAVMVETGIVAVLERVRVEPRVEEEMLKLKFVAAKVAFGSGIGYEDLTLSDTEATQSRTVISDIPRAPCYVHPSFRQNLEKPAASFSANSASTKPIPKSSETPLSLLCCAASPRSHPKLENFRVKLIRGMMRSIRDFTKSKHSYPKSGPHVIDVNDTEQVQRYEILRELFLTNRADLKPYGKTQNGPESSTGKKRDESQWKSTRPASYNDDFCKKLLTTESVSDYFQAYLSVVFSGSDPELWCQRLKVRCCAQAGHSPKCQEVWRQVQSFSRWGMLERLGLNPPDLYFTNAFQSPSISSNF